MAILTGKSIVGTSAKTPTAVAVTTGESAPKTAIATATDNSKKFDAPIMPAGAAMSCVNLIFLHAPYDIKKIRNVCMARGIAINRM